MQLSKFGIIQNIKSGTLFLVLCLPLWTASAMVSDLRSDTLTTKKKMKSINIKPNIQDSDSLNYDDSNDDELYTPYEKWRIDTFDNWGKHRGKINSHTEQDTSSADTLKVNKKKGFLDKEKESFLFEPDRRNHGIKERNCSGRELA